MVKLRQNQVKHKLKRGEVVTCVSGIMDPDTVDFFGQFGFDSVWIETEHGPIDYKDIPDMTRACDIWGMTSIVRVNQNFPGIIYRTLDVGTQGIVIPHVNTAEEARAVVDAAKFGPIGSRGMYSSRQAIGVPDYMETANDESLVIILIEDIVAVNNLADILTVDHIDVFFVAPNDLAQSMGHLDNIDHPEVQATIDRAFQQIISAGRTAGHTVNDDTVEDAIKKGVRFVMGGWQDWVASGATAYLKKVSNASR